MESEATCRLLSIVTAIGLVVGVGRLQAQPAGIEAALHQELVIGMEQEPPEALLADPVAVMTGPSGKIFVADNDDLQVKVFDPHGTFLRVFGQEGREPGEFMGVSGLGWTGSGGILVADPKRFCVSWFSPEGKFSGSRQVGEEVVQARSARVFTQQLDEDRFIVLGISVDQEAPDTPLFHLMTDSLTTEAGAFGSLSQFGSLDEPFWLRTMWSRPGRFWVGADQESLLYAPFLYEDRI